MTLAIAHKEGVTAILDAVREVRPPFNPEAVVAEFAVLLKSYRIASVQGDKFGGEWPATQFRKHGIGYIAAEKPKSDLYRDVLPVINAGAAALLDHDRLVAQLTSLERRTARGGRDSIDHPPGGHDDVANVVAGVLVRVSLGMSGTARDDMWRTSAPLRDPLAGARSTSRSVPMLNPLRYR
jgi:hypothetical protein